MSNVGGITLVSLVSVAGADYAEGDGSATALRSPGSVTLRAAFANWNDGRPYLSGPVVSTSLAVAP